MWYFEAVSWLRQGMESKLERSLMEGAKWSLKKFFYIVYDLQCDKIYHVIKKDFVLDRRDGLVADASVFRGESCAGDRVRFSRRSNLSQVANGPSLLRR